MSHKKIIGGALIAIGGIDFLFGDTNQPLLPDFIANHLTSKIDAVLIGVGIWIIFFM